MTLWNAGGDVVAFIDGSDESWRGFEWAHDEALRTGRNLVAVHVDVHGDTSDSHGHDLGTEVLTEAVARLAEEDSPVVFSTMRRPAPLRDAVQDLSRRAGLVVVGSGSRHLLQQHAIGRTHSLLGRTTCPMVVVTASPQCDADGVVTVGVSLSPGGLAAMRFACTEARLSRRTVVGVRAWADQDWKLDALGGDYTSVNDWRAVENFTLEHWLDHARFEFDDVAIEGRAHRLADLLGTRGPRTRVCPCRRRRATHTYGTTVRARAGHRLGGAARTWCDRRRPVRGRCQRLAGDASHGHTLRALRADVVKWATFGTRPRSTGLTYW